jgi:hypothetical protein
MSDKNYPTIQFRVSKQEKADFLELAAVRGTTISAMLKAFMQGEIASLPRERRISVGKPADDFLN